MPRWLDRLANLERAWARLQDACAKTSYSELELAGLIQMFEFTFELAWKTLRDLLVFEGHQVTSPREAIRVAFAAGLLGDAGLWLAALESRNRLSHTYDEQTAAEAEALIKNAYAPLVAALVERLRHKRSNP